MKSVARVASHGPSHGTRLRLILLCGGTGVALVLVTCPTARVEASNPQKYLLVNTLTLGVCVFGWFSVSTGIRFDSALWCSGVCFFAVYPEFVYTIPRLARLPLYGAHN